METPYTVKSSLLFSSLEKTTRKTKGFKLRRKLVKIIKRGLRPKRKLSGHQRLGHNSYNSKILSRICNWGRCLKSGAKRLCSSKPASDYLRFGPDLCEAKPVEVPKGHLAVYVGQKDDDPHRFLVPVFYFNHPLFGDLLREAEEEYGFHHSGGITIPCRLSEFESVQTRIASGDRRRNSMLKHLY